MHNQVKYERAISVINNKQKRVLLMQMLNLNLMQRKYQ